MSLDSPDCQNALSTSIPTEYYEIKILKEDFSLFGVKTKAEWWDKVEFRYTILDTKGKEYKKMSVFRNLDSQFTYYSEERVLTSLNKKMGFISTEGYITIPFKYDSVNARKDGSFDVSIGKRHGVLSTEGREIVPLKYCYIDDYNLKLDNNSNEYDTRKFYSRIVIDAESGGCGVLNEDGSELIPPLFEFIIGRGSLFFYAHCLNHDIGDCEDDWFDAELWGAMDANGKIITKPIYKCFDTHEKWLLAATYAHLGINDKYDNCVYDIFDLDTRQKVFGGINEIKDTENSDIKLLHIPLLRSSLDEEGEEVFTQMSDYGCWIIVNMRNLKSVLPTLNGHQYQFRLGDEFKYVFPKTKGGEYLCSHPKELFQDDHSLEYEPRVYRDYTIVKQINKRDSSYLVRNNDGAKTALYSSIFRIEDNCFYAQTKGYWSILINCKEILPLDEHFIMLTRICKGYCFGAKEIDGKNADIKLIHCTPEYYNENTVISKISLRVLSSLLWNNRLKLFIGNEDNQIYVKDNTFFDSGVSDLLVMKKELFSNDDSTGQALFKDWFTYTDRLLNAETFDDWE